MIFYPNTPGTVVYGPDRPGGPLNDATSRYQKALGRSPAADFLARKQLDGIRIKGITLVKWFRLGYVARPAAGHQQFTGALAIPYSRALPNGRDTIAFRFACVAPDCEHEGHEAVAGPANSRPRLFNQRPHFALREQTAVCFSEVDTITAFALGLRAVGIPGTSGWQESFADELNRYDRVDVIAPRDDGGKALGLAEHLAEAVPAASIIQCPEGQDLNAAFCAGTADAIIERCR